MHVYSSLLKALAMPDSRDTSCYPVRVCAAAAIVTLLDNDYTPPDWLPLLQVVIGRNSRNEDENFILFQLLSSVEQAGNENVAAHIPYYFVIVVGNGKRVRFWEDSWLEDQPLSFCFPRLFRLSRYASSVVERLVVRIHSSFLLSWDFGFRRNLNDLEIEEFASLMAKLENVRLVESKSDERRWKLESSGKFSCKSFHSFLIRGGIDPILAPAKFIWNSKAPTKVKILGWLVAHGRTNRCDNLQRRRPGCCFSPHWCILCKAQGESADHVFLHCDVANFLWKKLFREAKMVWTTPPDRKDLFKENPSVFGKGKKARIIWGCGAVHWVVWMERNRRLWERVKFWASLWAYASQEFKDFSLSSIVLNWEAAVA
ncbi:hypothetical protein ACLB2K_037190 [Fragaria x ananassa]